MGSVDEAGGGSDALQGLGLSDRKRNLLEARLLGQSNSLEVGNSNSLGSQGPMRYPTPSSSSKDATGGQGNLQQHQQQDLYCSMGGGGLTSPSLAHRSSVADPTLLEASESHSNPTPGHSRDGHPHHGRGQSPQDNNNNYHPRVRTMMDEPHA